MKANAARKSLGGNPRKKLKAFTLIETIIVIGIIGVLASIGSVGIAAFIRNANITSDNDAARQGFTAVQNLLINWEIRSPGTPDSVINLMQPNNNDLTGVEMTFVVRNGWVITIDVLNHYGGVKNASSPMTLNPVLNTDEFEKLALEIEKNLGAAMDGQFTVYIDYENYHAVGSIYRPPGRPWIVQLDYVGGSFVNSNQSGNFYFADLGHQRANYRDHGIRNGVYPYIMPLARPPSP